MDPSKWGIQYIIFNFKSSLKVLVSPSFLKGGNLCCRTSSVHPSLPSVVTGDQIKVGILVSHEENILDVFESDVNCDVFLLYY